jgi:hypothetical protein
MDDLVERFELTGSGLVKEVAQRLGPETTIESTLNMVRNIQMRRYARLLQLEKIHNVFESIEYLRKNFDLNTEDILSVLRFIPEFPSVSSGLVDKFIEHLRPKRQPGCFTWARIRR